MVLGLAFEVTLRLCCDLVMSWRTAGLRQLLALMLYKQIAHLYTR